MNYLTSIKNKRIVILGAGLSGYSCARFLDKHGVSLILNDSRETPLTSAQRKTLSAQVSIVKGGWCADSLGQAEIIIASPGIDLNDEHLAALLNPEAEIIGDVELYCRMETTPILAVTGSNGKSTVVSLLTHVTKSLGVNAQLGGNIGTPVLDYLTDESPVELLILELSSFQLETLRSMRSVAATILNISDDHLDRHKTLANYAAIKQRIYQQTDLVVINRQDQLTACSLDNKNVISFGIDSPQSGQFGLRTQPSENGEQVMYLAYGEQLLIALDKLPLAGIHNAQNYLAVLALGYSYGFALNDMVKSFLTFKGLAHRCEKVASNDHITWVNDSKATNVGATLAAIEGLSPTISKGNHLLLIAGGDGKGADFSPLTAALSSKVSRLFTLGKDGEILSGLHNNAQYFTSLAACVKAAKVQAKPGDMVLLSPACASIDMFKNFIERGELFKQYVQEGTDV